jgi:hypothetical protein
MSGSGASNLGYGGTYPNSNVNGQFVNKDNSHYAGGFGSNEVPGLPGLAGAKYNVDAAAGYVPGICMKGGKRKIKNITKRYKMSKSKKRTIRTKLNKMKTRVKAALSRALARTRSRSRTRGLALAGGRRRKHMRSQKGGYSQYMNNMPVDRTYSVGGLLGAGDLNLANPPPIKLLAGSAYDNYNHNANTTFPSRGH